MKKRILAALMTVIMTMTVICVPNVIAEASNNDVVIKNDETGIPDVALYNLILAAGDGNSDGILMLSEAEQITELTVDSDTSQDDVKSLQGIKYCKGLKSLVIQEQEIDNISELAYLTNLEILILRDNNITDITVLSNLKNLKTLRLDGYRISDITAVSALTNLEDLSLESLCIDEDDLNALESLGNLKELYIGYSVNAEINDITALASLTSLVELDLWGLEINDISPLSNLKNLYMLTVADTEISDITPLAGLNELEHLSLPYNNISDLSVLKELTKLKSAWMSGNRIRDISILDTLTCDVIVDDNPIGIEEPIIWNAADGIPNGQLFAAIKTLADKNEDGYLTIEEAEGVTELEVRISGWEEEVKGIGYCKNLKKLILSTSVFANLEGIEKLDNLEYLDLSDGFIEDITSLSYLKNLDYLDLSDNKIIDITALANLEKLNYLDLSYNKITDASAISQLPNLEYLNLEGNPIKAEKPTEPDKPTVPDTPTTPDTPSTPQQPSNPNTPEIEDAPVIESYTDTQVVLDVTEKPVIKKAYFEAIVQLNNEHYEVVFHAGDDVYITFGQGTMNMVECIEDYDFTVDINPDYDSSKVPTTLGKESFVSKVIYNYSGKLPAMASIRIPVGTEYAEKTLYYTLLNEDSTFGISQKVVVDKDGYITVNQDHCSSYVITTKDMSVKETTPNTGDNTSIFLWMMVLTMGGCLCFIGAKKKNII